MSRSFNRQSENRKSKAGRQYDAMLEDEGVGFIHSTGTLSAFGAVPHEPPAHP
jgi:hypothetical protein